MSIAERETSEMRKVEEVEEADCNKFQSRTHCTDSSENNTLQLSTSETNGCLRRLETPDQCLFRNVDTL